MRIFSKSKLIALRQCSKRLWLEIHRPELRADSEQSEMRFQIGHQVGEIARRIYDPEGLGTLIDINAEGFSQAFARSANLLKQPKPIFEAGFSAGGALAFADVMLPCSRNGKLAWRMIEVKSSTSLKDYQREDIAIQTYIATAAGVPLDSVALAHIDSSWVYPGNQDYRGLLTENDLTEEARSRSAEVKEWIAQANMIAAFSEAPEIECGKHCSTPFECGFFAYCNRNQQQPEYPVYWLPGVGTTGIQKFAEKGIHDLREIPDELINPIQQRVKAHTLTNTVFFDAAGAAEDLSSYLLPLQFLDFETIQYAVPIWAGTRPYQFIPFQFSLHVSSSDGKLWHEEFLGLSGNDPSQDFVNRLVGCCSKQPGSIFVYNASFEKTRIGELAKRFPFQSDALFAIRERIVDLLPIARNRYYHPSQQGSWSIKAVLPAIVPDLKYSDLEGVQDGHMAMESFNEAISPQTTPERKDEIRKQLLVYCKLDTYAMVRLWQFFSGRNDIG